MKNKKPNSSSCVSDAESCALPQIAAFQRLVQETIALFHRLKAAAEQIHAQGELTGGKRGLLRELYIQGPRTVPQMAKARPVSRQHIQKLVNELLQEGLVALTENPQHKRSKLLWLTPRGKQHLEEMLERESQLLSQVDFGLAPEELLHSAQVLRQVREVMSQPAWSRLVAAVKAKSSSSPL